MESNNSIMEEQVVSELEDTVEKKKERRNIISNYTLVEYNNYLTESIDFVNEVIKEACKNTNKNNQIRKFIAIRNNLTFLKKTLPHTIKNSRKKKTISSEPKQNPFDSLKNLTPEFCDFLSLPHGSQLSLTDIGNAIRAYIFINPEEKRESILRWKYLNVDGRDLRNPERKKEIFPDELLKNILKYNQYVIDVNESHVIKKTKDKLTGLKTEQVETNSQLTYNSLFRLFSNLYTK